MLAVTQGSSVQQIFFQNEQASNRGSRWMDQSMVEYFSGVVQPVSQLRQDQPVRVFQRDYVPEFYIIFLFSLIGYGVCILGLLLVYLLCQGLQNHSLRWSGSAFASTIVAESIQKVLQVHKELDA